MDTAESGPGGTAAVNDTVSFRFCEIANRQDVVPKLVELAWADFCSRFSTPDIGRGKLPLAEYQALDSKDSAQKERRSAEKDGPAWLPASFKVGAQRRTEEVEVMTAFVGDCDDGQITLKEIQQRLRGLEYFAHTTYSHTPEKPKARFIVLFERPIRPERLEQVFDHFNAVFDGHLDPVGKKPAQLYYTPSCPPDAGPTFCSYRGVGVMFNADPLGTRRNSYKRAEPEGKSVVRFGRRTIMPPPCRDGERHTVALSAIGRWLAQGFGFEEVLTLIREWNGSNLDRWPDEKLVELVKGMLKTDERNHTERHLPPLWDGIQVPTGYSLSHDGVYLLSDRSANPEKPAKPDVKISGPVWVSAATRDPQSKGWGKRIEWIDGEGQHQQAAIPAERFHEQGNALSQELARDGLVIIPGREKALATYLGSFSPQHYLRSVARLGWLDDARGRLVFVQPERAYSKTAEETHVFQPERHSPTVSTIHAQGTLPRWQEEVASQVRGNPLLVFGACLGFAGPLMKPLNIESGGFHFYGRSSHGKTTLVQVAASIWGCGADPAADPALSYVQRWNATLNGLEGLASAHNDGLIALDEIGTCTAKDFGQVIYALAGGRGKAAMNQDRNMKQIRTWRLLFMSTGEISARQKMEEENRTPKAGQLLRMLDIPILSGVVEDPHDLPPSDYVNRLKAACSGIYGTAGPAYVEVLAKAYADFEALRCALTPRLDKAMADLAVAGLEPEQKRALRRLALVVVAGELASQWGVLPFDRAEILEAAKVVRDAWLHDLDMLPDAERGVESVRAFILKHKSRFQDVSEYSEEEKCDGDGEPPAFDFAPRDQAGYLDSKRKLYLFTPEALREAVRGHDLNGVLRELVKRDLLFRNDNERYVSKHHVPGVAKRLSLYAVKFRVLEDDRTDD